MFCSNCGTQISEGEKFCPNCGTPVGEPEIKGFTLNENSAPVNDQYAGGSYNGNDSYSNNGNGNSGSFVPNQSLYALRTDRSLLIYFLLNMITCGIYGLVFFYMLIGDVNKACDGDGEQTPGLLSLILLSIVTCGIYSYYWFYKLGNRLSNNLQRNGYQVSENGTTVLLWMIFGWFMCGIGQLIGLNIIITQTNSVCMCYNRNHGIG